MSNPPPKGNRHKYNKRRKSFKASAAAIQNEFIFGLHAIQAALDLTTTRIKEILLAEQRHDPRINAIITAAQQHDIRIEKVARSELDELLPNTQHQGVIARCEPLAVLDETDLVKLLDVLDEVPLLLILDGVQDPHNLGACIRTAEAAGAHAVIAPKNRAATLTDTVLKVSSGAAERLPFIQITNLARLLRELQQYGIRLVGTAGNGETTLFVADLKGPLAMVLGAENRGMRRLTREHCDQIVTIPMQGKAESLNVSVAAGICLFEARRQRLQFGG